MPKRCLRKRATARFISAAELGNMPGLDLLRAPDLSHRIYIIVAGVLVASLLAGCARLPKLSMPKFGIPRVHKVTVQQGNLVSQEMVDQLKPGMTRSQVTFIMGEPIFRNTFDNSRWDYIYMVESPGRYEQERKLSLYFENETLAYFVGDFVPSDQQPASEENTETEATDGS